MIRSELNIEDLKNHEQDGIEHGRLEKSLSKIIDDKATVYDQQIDKFYNETHIGGFTHRHFDDHAFHLMWQKVKDTLPNDTKFEEIKNYFISMSKDLQTPMGIPLHKINDKESYYCIEAERALLEAIGGDCDTAIGGLAKLSNEKISLKSQLFSNLWFLYKNYDSNYGLHNR